MLGSMAVDPQKLKRRRVTSGRWRDWSGQPSTNSCHSAKNPIADIASLITMAFNGLAPQFRVGKPAVPSMRV
jgi:hypothetical protein